MTTGILWTRFTVHTGREHTEDETLIRLQHKSVLSDDSFIHVTYSHYQIREANVSVYSPLSVL